jgi:NAD(P)-dependent dehydrogenase (short-subunit alcohol dehydrogenase family)
MSLQEDIMSINLMDKVALVTGAASGVGRATALKFADLGAKVVVADVDETGGYETVRLVRECGAEAIFVHVDIADEASVRKLVEVVKSTYGHLDYAVNNAGVLSSFTLLHEKTVTDFDRIISVNLRGTFLCMKYEIELLIENGGGAIVNTSSIAGLVAVPGIADYVASKHGVNGITRTAAVEYASFGIRVNAINPGGIDTPMASHVEYAPGFAEVMKDNSVPVPMKRIGTPQEMANTIVWLCSDEASYITGACLPVDGAYTAA